MYGQILRRMPLAANDLYLVAVVVPTRAVRGALDVPERVRQLLRISVYSVDENGSVEGPLDAAG